MRTTEIITEYIKVIFSYESKTIRSYQILKNYKLKDAFQIYASYNSLNLNSIFFLYGGKQIDNNCEETIINVASPNDKKRNEMMILVYQCRDEEEIISIMSNFTNIQSEAHIIFSYDNKEIIKIPCNKNEKMRNICTRFANKIHLNLDSLILTYSGQQFSYEMTFNQIANKYDQICNGMTILAYKNNNISKEVTLNSTVDPSFSQYNNSYQQKLPISETGTILTFHQNRPIPETYRISRPPPSCCKKHKRILKIIIIISILLLIGLAIFLTIFFLKKKNDGGNRTIQILNETQTENSSDIQTDIEAIQITDVETIQTEDILEEKCKEGVKEKCKNCFLNICLECNEGYDLYNGKCYVYSFE